MSKERVLILVLDDVKTTPRDEYLRVLNFLGVYDDGRELFPALNAAKVWRPVWFGELVKNLKRRIYVAKYKKKWLPKRSLGIIPYLQKIGTHSHNRNPLPENVRQVLEAYYEEDIHLLENLLKRDFSKWLEPHRNE